MTILLLAFTSELYRLLRRLGGIDLVAVGIVDSSVIPAPGSLDVLTLLLATGQEGLWPYYYALMSWVGAMTGGFLTYRLGSRGGAAELERRLRSPRLDRVRGLTERWGSVAVFVAALLPPPVPLTPFLLAAGALRQSPRNFFLGLGGARAIRYGTLAYLGSHFGRRALRLVGRNSRVMLPGLVVAVAAVVVGLALYYVLRRRGHAPR